MDSQINQSISDDQELAKALAGVSQNTDAPAGLQFEETGNPAPVATGFSPAITTQPEPATPVTDPVVMPDPTPVTDPVVMPDPTPAPITSGPAIIDPILDTIKQTALGELRPLIDKLNVSPEEKFDTYLLLLRSTDDKDLVAPAHDAAIAITDEARRAQALLDIIKEIDYLSNPQ